MAFELHTFHNALIHPSGLIVGTNPKSALPADAKQADIDLVVGYALKATSVRDHTSPIGLVGSRALGLVTPGSDWDVFVDLDTLAYSAMCSEEYRRLGNAVARLFAHPVQGWFLGAIFDGFTPPTLLALMAKHRPPSVSESHQTVDIVLALGVKGHRLFATVMESYAAAVASTTRCERAALRAACRSDRDDWKIGFYQRLGTPLFSEYVKVAS